MRAFFTAVLAGMTLGCARAPRTALPSPPTAYDVMDEVNRLATMDLWPGFDPRRTPVMIFDGETTYLFNHPAVPPGFHSLSSRQGVSAVPGRHASVTANSSVTLDGVQTATVMLQGSSRSATAAASLAIHEAFHAFQREKHPAWTANEVELFTFPVTDTAIVARQRLEAAALRQALMTQDPSQSGCWAAAAMRIRQERFTLMSAGAATYERGTELNEGLASYVEKRAIDVPDSTVLSSTSFPPQAVRQRSYSTGLAIARLLDRLSPDWRSALELNDTNTLDSMLSTALAGRPAAPSNCGFDAVGRDAAQLAALTDIESLRANREQARIRFLTQPGWTLVIAATSPLFPQGFDPLNVQMLTDGEVLHTRFVKLGNDRGTLEVIDRSTLTTPAGAHPMFNGIRTATIAGLPSDLSVTRSGAGVAVRAKGVQVDLNKAAADTSGSVITLRLLP